MHIKNIETRNVLSMDEAELRIRMGQTVYTKDTPSDRGLGKTTLLAKLASDMETTLIVDNRSLAYELRTRHPGVHIIPISEIESLRGKYPIGKHILTDESSKANQESLIDYLHNAGYTCGGFQLDYYLYYKGD